MTTSTVELSDLDGADLVVVTTNLNQELHRVSDAGPIGRLAAWLSERQEGWYVPPDGVRIMKIRLNFSAGGRSLGSIGLGERYLVAQRQGKFYQRDAESGDREAVLAILGMKVG